MTGGVYVITNTVTGEQYVGTTKNLREREAIHWNALAAGRHEVKAMQSSYDRHGRDAFTFTALETWEGAWMNREREREWMLKLRPSFNVITPWRKWPSRPDAAKSRPRIKAMWAVRRALGLKRGQAIPK